MSEDLSYCEFSVLYLVARNEVMYCWDSCRFLFGESFEDLPRSMNEALRTVMDRGYIDFYETSRGWCVVMTPAGSGVLSRAVVDLYVEFCEE